jgi:predicted DCC family thiol-disulfide oxidoreductase YuxK
MSEERLTIFFDGYCGLCDRFVTFVLHNPAAGRFRYAPLQGETYKEVKTKFPHLSDMDSVILHRIQGDQESVHAHSDAALQILSRMEGIMLPRLAKVALWIPRSVRDFAYRIVARNRYSIFGKRDTCRLPTAEERNLFLP